MRRRVLDPKGWLQTSPTEETSKCVPSRPMSCTFFFGGAAAGKYPLPESSQGRICRPLSQPELRTTRVQGRRGQAAAARDTIAVTIGRPLDSGRLSCRTSHVYMHMGGVGHTTAGGGGENSPEADGASRRPTTGSKHRPAQPSKPGPPAAGVASVPPSGSLANQALSTYLSPVVASRRIPQSQGCSRAPNGCSGASTGATR